MGARCAVHAKEADAATGKPRCQQHPVGKDTSGDVRFYQEKMRFSTSSQTLFAASLYGDAALAESAVRGLGDPNSCSEGGYRSLQVAVACGNPALVELLLKAGADINCSAGAPPPLVLAAGNGDVKLFETLLGFGADMSVADEVTGETALLRASDRGHRAIVHLILSKGTPGFQKLLVQRPRSGPKGDGTTALHLAASRGFADICDRLLAVGANPNATDRIGCMPLHRAVESNHVETANMLLTFGGAAKGQDASGQAPLHIVADHGFLTMADLLVRFSADVDVRRSDGQGPTHLASKNGHDAICQLLLAQRAEPNIVDKNGETPFSLAFREAHVRCCRALLDGGAEVRAVQDNRWAPPYTELQPSRAQAASSDDTFRDLVTC